MHAAFNARDFAALDAIFAMDFYSHSLETHGPASVRERWTAIAAASPGLRTEVLDVVVEGDRAFLRSRLDDGSGELYELLRISNGRIAELWGARGS